MSRHGMRPTDVRTFVGVAVLAAALVALTGCGDDSGPTVDIAATPTVADVTLQPDLGADEPTEIASPDPGYDETEDEYSDEWLLSPVISVADSQGYTYDVQVRIDQPTVESDTLNALPGEVDLAFTFTGSLDVTNTTPGRNAPVPNFYVKTAWRSSSAICHEGTSGSYLNENLSRTRQPYCELIDALETNAYGDTSTTLGPGESTTQTFEGGNSRSVPENTADKAAKELENPALWELAGRFDGPNRCLVETGSIYAIWTSIDVGCGVRSGKAT